MGSRNCWSWCPHPAKITRKITLSRFLFPFSFQENQAVPFSFLSLRFLFFRSRGRQLDLEFDSLLKLPANPEPRRSVDYRAHEGTMTSRERMAKKGSSC